MGKESVCFLCLRMTINSAKMQIPTTSMPRADTAIAAAKVFPRVLAPLGIVVAAGDVVDIAVMEPEDVADDRRMVVANDIDILSSL